MGPKEEDKATDLKAIDTNGIADRVPVVIAIGDDNANGEKLNKDQASSSININSNIDGNISSNISGNIDSSSTHIDSDIMGDKSSTDNATQLPKKRRQYSRNGCRECKRRKLKCDEGKPFCYNCSHLNKTCIYEKRIKFTDSRSFTISKDSNQNQSVGSKPSFVNLNTQNQFLSNAFGNQTPIIMSPPTISSNSSPSVQVALPISLPLSLQAPTQIKPPIQVPSSAQKVNVDPFLDPTPMVVQYPAADISSSLPPINSNIIHNSPNFSSINNSNNQQNSSNIPQNNKNYNFNPFPLPNLDALSNNLDFLNNTASNGSNTNTNTNTNANTNTNTSKSSQKLDLENYLFHGATNLITDLNQFISNVDFDFPVLPNVNVDFHQSSKLPTFRFDDISPTNYSVSSANMDDKPPKITVEISNTDEDEEEEEDDEEKIKESNHNYIRTLTQSLSDYSSPKTTATKSPNNSEHVDSPISSDSSGKYSIANTNMKAFPAPKNSNNPYIFDYTQSLNSTITQTDLVNLADFFGWSLQSSHIKYLKVFVTKIHLNFLPFSSSYLNNAYINTFLLQAKHSPHLLFAVLAISARYESYQVEKNPNITNNNEKLAYHKRFGTYYLSSCLKSLDSILHSKSKTLNNIESLLLTILILASDFSGLTGSQWRTHLHGAKDLLIKYCKFRPISLELTIVWLWFYSMEVLAWLTSPNGGTIHDFNELDEFLQVVKSNNTILGHSLKYFGFLLPGTSYNLYMGYDDLLIDIFNDLVYALESLQRAKKNNPPENMPIHPRQLSILTPQNTIASTYLLPILGKLQKARESRYISNQPPYRIPQSSPYHPKNNPEKDSILISTYIHNTNPQTRSNDDSNNWYSWIDLSQQLYADAALLRVLTLHGGLVGLGISITSEIVQDVVRRMLWGLSSLIQFNEDVDEYNINVLREYYDDLLDDNEIKNNDNKEDASKQKSRDNMENVFKEAVDFGKYLWYQIDNRLVMVQWPLYVCGLCCIEAKQKVIIDCCFNGLINLSVGSGELSLNKLKKVWRLQKLGLFDYQDYDLFNDNDDSVPFT